MATEAEREAWKTILTGQTLGAYRLISCIGSGHFALVFEAEHTGTNSPVAVKVLLPGSDTHAIVDFENERVLLDKLRPCESVVAYLDGGEQSIDMVSNGITVPLGVRFHVLAPASASLDEIVLDPAALANLDWRERIRFFRAAAKAVHQMHRAGVAHRDLKSSNCLLMVVGTTSKLRLADLGRAKDMKVPATMPVEAYLAGRGDLRFAPPEFLWLLGGDTAADFMAADYYGLGSLLVELTTGHPLTGLTHGDVAAVLRQAALEYQRGHRGDLSTLRLQYRKVIAEIVDQMPKSIRSDATVLLTSLCDPQPAERLSRPPFHRDRLLEPLEWVIRRSDIMIRRLEIDAREERRSSRKMERATS